MEQKTLSKNTGAEKAKLFPTDIGMVVTDFLVEHFEKVMDYNFTAQVEEEFDTIAEGRREWTEMIDIIETSFLLKTKPEPFLCRSTV